MNTRTPPGLQVETAAAGAPRRHGAARPLSAAALVFLVCTLAVAAAPDETREEARPVGQRLLRYLPNRLLDLCDMLRARVRVGPGWGISARATEPVSVFVGDYRSYFFGFPGARHPRSSRLPWGKEEHRGVSVGKADATDENPCEPDWSPTEFDVGLHVAVVGAELGTDPVEWWDFLCGLLFLDPRGDDR